MKVVGITGGIGSGKSTVCRLFTLLRVPVFDADAEAKKLYDEARIKKQVVHLFDKSILTSGGEIDKPKLAQIIFSEKESLSQINSIIHPAVRKKFLKWKQAYKAHKYIIKEAAIMVESGTVKDVDFVVAINSPKSLRLQRALNRGGLTRHQILARMNQQLSDKARNSHVDAIILNDDKHSLIEQVLALHKKLTT